MQSLCTCKAFHVMFHVERHFYAKALLASVQNNKKLPTNILKKTSQHWTQDFLFDYKTVAIATNLDKEMDSQESNKGTMKSNKNRKEKLTLNNFTVCGRALILAVQDV